MIGTVLAVWVAASIPASLILGRLLRGTGDRYPLYDPTHVNIVYGGSIVRPYPLGQAELQKIVNLFDRAALVVDEPLDGYTEIVFPDPDDAVHFVRVVRDGRHGGAVFVENVVTVLRVPDGGPVTLGVTLVPAWRPVAGGVAA